MGEPEQVNAVPFQRRAWQVEPQPPTAKITAIADHFQLTETVAALVYQRVGDNFEQIARFLATNLSDLADPVELPGIAAAVDLIVRAIRETQPIVIFGDYDADGITAAALLHDILSASGAKVSCTIPDRSDGYGLTVRAVQTLASDTGLIITVDNGIAAVDAAAEASARNVRLIVTDHHQIGPQLPAADAIVHPALDGYDGQWQSVSGAGVALALAIAVRRACRESGIYEAQQPHLGGALELAAIGTVADMVPLEGANRIIVREGLARLRRTNHPGIQHMLHEARREAAQLDAEDIAFAIAPRINAVGRVGRAQTAFECLAGSDAAAVLRAAEQLEVANRARKRVQEQIAAAVAAQVQYDGRTATRPAIVAAHPDWSHGVLGIVAGMLARDHNCPVILFQIQGAVAKGSARSIPGIDLMQALEPTRGWCESLGGHPDAAGMTVPREHLSAFRETFWAGIAAQLQTHPVTQSLQLDAVLPLSDIRAELLEDLERLAPFGVGNRAPLFASDYQRPRSYRVLGGKHLALQFGAAAQPLRAIAFQQARHAGIAKSTVQLAYRPAPDHYIGGDAIQLLVEDIRPGGF